MGDTVQPQCAAVLRFNAEPGSLLAAHPTRAGMRLMVYDGKAVVPGTTLNLSKQTKTVRGPLVDQIDAAVALVLDELAQGPTPSGSGLKTPHVHPERAVKAAKLYPPQHRQSIDAELEGVTVTLLDLRRPGAWDEVSDWIDRQRSIANADVVRIAKIDPLKASKPLAAWREQGLLAPLPGRGKRNMAYAKAAQGGDKGSLLSVPEENSSGAQDQCFQFRPLASGVVHFGDGRHAEARPLRFKWRLKQ